MTIQDQIITLLIEEPSLYISEIAQSLETGNMLIVMELSKLRKAGIVTKLAGGNRKGYRPKYKLTQ